MRTQADDKGTFDLIAEYTSDVVVRVDLAGIREHQGVLRTVEVHGGDNSSSTCFIDAVAPRYLIFPAGHETHLHPRAAAAARFLAGTPPKVPADRILRTDRGDDQGVEEFDGERIAGCTDQTGDDDIEIILSNQPGTDVSVHYGGSEFSEGTVWAAAEAAFARPVGAHAGLADPGRGVRRFGS